MSSELEAAGAAVSAGLVASALDKPTDVGGRAVAHGACSNCGAERTDKFCATCGQPAHIHRTILHMAEELLHGVLHFDTRAWRTLPILIFRPGTLTYNYIHGKRARYISPIALFLLTIFTMFFVFALTGGSMVGANSIDRAESVAGIEADISEQGSELAAAEADIARAEAALAALGDGAENAEDRGKANEDLEDANARARDARMALRVLEGSLRAVQGAAADAFISGVADGAEIEATGMQGFYDEIAEAARNGDITVNTGFKSVDKKILAKLQNPELAIYKIQNTAYKFSFLLIPISLPFMWLLFFWKRGVTLFDHSVFVLYSLSFMSLLFVTGAMAAMGPEWLVAAFSSIASIGVPLHLYFQMKGAYALGWFSALWRLVFLVMFCLLALSIFLLVIIVLGLAG